MHFSDDYDFFPDESELRPLTRDEIKNHVMKNIGKKPVAIDSRFRSLSTLNEKKKKKKSSKRSK